MSNNNELPEGYISAVNNIKIIRWIGIVALPASIILHSVIPGSVDARFKTMPGGLDVAIYFLLYVLALSLFSSGKTLMELCLEKKLEVPAIARRAKALGRLGLWSPLWAPWVFGAFYAALPYAQAVGY